MIVGTNNPVMASQVWEDSSYQPIEHETGTPPQWELIFDPTDSMVIGGCFRTLDVINNDTNSPWDCWTPGMKFQHIKSKRVMEIYTVTKYTNRKNRIITTTKLKFRIVKPSDQMELQL